MSITRLLIQTLDVILLKFEKLWTVIIPKIMIFYQWIKDGWKRGTLPFKTLFLPSRYDSRLPRYHRAKGKVIFHRSLPTRRSFGSHWPSRLSQTRDERQSRLLEKRNNTILGTRFRERMKVILLAVHYALRKLWVLDRDIDTNRKLIRMARFSLYILRVDFDDEISFPLYEQ